MEARQQYRDMLEHEAERIGGTYRLALCPSFAFIPDDAVTQKEQIFVEEIIRHYHESGFDLAPGASLQAIQTTQQTLDCIFPETLSALYQDHNGMRPSRRAISLRLMSLDEVVELYQAVKDFGWTEWGLRAFWTDDNSNYAGLYVAGPLIGKVCLFDHEEADSSPAYRSLDAFLTTQITAIPQESDWYDLRRDYPVVEPTSDHEAAAADWQIAQVLQPLYESSQEDARIHYAFCRMAITPYEHTDTLLTFTQDDDMYIQERACDLLGQRRYESAIERLAEVALNGMPDGRSAAIRALGIIGTDEARSQLQNLLMTLPKQYSNVIRHALRATQ